MDNRRFLKVKLKSLAAEARIIRLEETRSHGDLRNRLHEHRVGIVRREARHTHLAYAYLRGRAYHDIERTCITRPNRTEIARMVKKYGQQDMDLTWFDAEIREPKAA